MPAIVRSGILMPVRKIIEPEPYFWMGPEGFYTSTYEPIGAHEDLSDLIYKIDPFDTPMFDASVRYAKSTDPFAPLVRL